MSNTNTQTEARAVKVSHIHGMEVKRFVFKAVEARKHFAKDSVVDVNASGNVVEKYKAGVDVFIEIGSDGIGSWEVASSNDDGYGSGGLCIENNEVVDFDGAFDLPWRVKNMLTALGYKLTW
jgi:hypothetical protein